MCWEKPSTFNLEGVIYVSRNWRESIYIQRQSCCAYEYEVEVGSEAEAEAEGWKYEDYKQSVCVYSIDVDDITPEEDDEEEGEEN